MKFPNANEVKKLIANYNVPIVIKKHLEKVTDVGVLLATGMKNSGSDINIELVRSGCLIHDAFKVASLNELVALPQFNYIPSKEELKTHRELRSKYIGIHETLIAADIIKPKYPEFSKFVANIGSTGNPTYMNEEQENFLELQVMHYADWRVQWDQISDFDDRLDYLAKTYLNSTSEKEIDRWEKLKIGEKEIEKKIFDLLPYEPKELNNILNKQKEE